MKKRSLFAAVAMLIVSAIVLTSSTYAWFKGVSTVTVPTISASVSGSDGTLLLSADGGSSWDITFTESQITDLVKPTGGVLTPISVTPNATELKAMSGSLSGTAFTSSNITSSFTGGIKYSYMIKSTTDATVNVTPNFTAGVDFGYCYVVTNNGASGADAQTLTKLIGVAASRQYKPIAFSGSEVTGTDTNGNGYLEDAEDVALAAQQTTEANSVAMAVNAKANTPITVQVYMWAEGNDQACTGSASGAPSIAFTVAKAS